MAESILKLKVDSQEYDAKIKRAAEGLRAMESACRSVGGTFEVVEKEELAFVEALGKMDTVGKNAKSQMRELQQALTDMTMMYRNLSDAEKSSPFGKALNKSIQELTERAGNAKDAMMDVQQAITNAASDTRKFDQFNGIISTSVSSFQSLTGAAELFGVKGLDNVEVLAKLQSAMALVNGLSTIQNALQEQSAMMQGLNALKTAAAATAQGLYALATGEATAAQTAFNIAADANPWGALIAVIGVAAGAISMFVSKTNDATDAQNREAAAQKRATEMAKLKSSAMKTQTDKYIEQEAKIRQLVATAENENRSLEDRNAACRELNSMSPKINANINTVTGAFTAQTSAIAELTAQLRTYYKMLATQDYLTELYKKQVELEVKGGVIDQWVQGADYNLGVYTGKMNKAQAGRSLDPDRDYDSDPITPAEAQSISDATGDYLRNKQNVEHYASSSATAHELQSQNKQAQAELNKTIGVAEKIYTDLQKENAGYKPTEIKPVNTGVGGGHSGGGSGSGHSGGGHSGGGSGSGGGNTDKQEYVPKEGSLDWFQALLQYYKQEFQSAVDDAGRFMAEANIEAIEGAIKQMEEKAKNSLIISRWDGNVYDRKGIDYGVELGVGGSHLLQAPSSQLIDTSKGMALMKYIYQHTPDDDKKKFSVFGKSGNKKDYSESGALGFASDLQSGLSNLSSSLQTFGLSQDSWFAKIIDKFGAVIGILTAIQTIATTIEAINTIGSIIPLARGGVVHAAGGVRVPGNYMSGDRVPAMLNSGELVLNRAQQGNIASQLQGSGFGQMQLSATIKGEDIRLALNNNSRRRGKGEYVTSRG